jgi:hypothetical protein
VWVCMRPNDQANRPAATDAAEQEAACRRVRLSAWLGVMGLVDLCVLAREA